MDFNTDNYVFFVLADEHGRNASFGFRAVYTDVEGNLHKLESHQIDRQTGEKIVRKYRFQKGHKTLRIHKAQKEELEFLRNHPNCQNSPNGYYATGSDGVRVQKDIWFSEINTERDAEQGVKYRVLRHEAGNRILELSSDEQSLLDFGIVVGYTGSLNTVLFKLMEHAEKDPEFILSELDSPDMLAKSLYMEGKNSGIIIRKGISYMLEDFEIGIDDNSCIKTIKTSDDVQKLLKKKLGKSDDEEVIVPDVPVEAEEEAVASEVEDSSED